MQTPSDLEFSLCIETVTGKLVNPSNPDVASIDLNDIAWALSRMPRFAGHTITETPYNVAQHSIYVSELLDELLHNDVKFTDDQSVLDAAKRVCTSSALSSRRLVIKALFHDAHEAYLGDIPSPIKRIPELRPVFKAIEAKLDTAIYRRLSLDLPTEDEHQLIKYCDKLAQAIESYQYMPSRGVNWGLPSPTLIRLQQFPEPLTPLKSYQAFLNRYESLIEICN